MNSTQSDHTPDICNPPRRSVLAATAVTAGVLVAAAGTAPTAGAAPLSPHRAPGSGPDDPVLRADRELLRVKLTSAPKPVPLTLSTSSKEPFSVDVSSTTGRTTVGAGPRARQGAKVTVKVAAGKDAVVWVVPKKTGDPFGPADQLDVSSVHDGTTVPVWIEPTAGEWRHAGPDDKELDLEIVAVHAAQLRKGAGQEIIMWSSPRQRNKDGSPKPDPGQKGQWLWNVYGLDDMEARALDVATLRTTDRIMDGNGGPDRQNIFCGGSAHLPDGRLFVAGGHVIPPGLSHEGHSSNGGHMHIYDPTKSGGWTLVDQPMSQVRWYPTVTCLPDGRMLISSGSRKVLEGNGNDGDADGFWTSSGNSYEIFDPATEQLVDLGTVRLIDTKKLGKRESLATYPYVYVLPKGPDDGAALALVESNRTWLYDYAPDSDTPLQRADRVYRMRTKGSRSYPTYGSMVLLPIEADSPRARILAVGGQHESQTDHRTLSADQPSTATAEILDLDASRDLADQRAWRRIPGLRNGRVLCDATLLADGSVLVSGGSANGWGDMNKNPVKQSELFDPVTEKFTPAASNLTDRRYHSTALLQPDGTLFKAGSTGGFGNERNPGDKGYKWTYTHTDAERYYPPYLWRGPRPSIGELTSTGGEVLRYGGEFTLPVSGASADGRTRVAVVRLGSTTHGNEMDQRYVWLDVRERRETDTGWELTVAVPANPASAPPGDYYVLAVDSAGVPSEAKLVRLGA
ncbi:glyoxal oxidase [Streptomyces sp. MZ04]|uniref:glyoxal oxidase n=1 Tax=Streptomyces sp. MZ04 TaxID=2559236 RepID=UPI00107E8642|nr:glyoxal oxidase [Streptomyces sp. MZ04]TGB03162.1 DUF1929 domain-containing protein [Streptomyces sp. MZ04]